MLDNRNPPPQHHHHHNHHDNAAASPTNAGPTSTTPPPPPAPPPPAPPPIARYHGAHKPSPTGSVSDFHPFVSPSCPINDYYLLMSTTKLPSFNVSPFPPPLHFSRSQEHTSELQSLRHLVCRLLL